MAVYKLAVVSIGATLFAEPFVAPSQVSGLRLFHGLLDPGLALSRFISILY